MNQREIDAWALKWNISKRIKGELTLILETERQKMQEQADSWKVLYEASQEALAECIAEVRQACEILGGPEFTKDVISLASEASLALDLTEAMTVGYTAERRQMQERIKELEAELEATNEAATDILSREGLIKASHE